MKFHHKMIPYAVAVLSIAAVTAMFLPFRDLVQDRSGIVALVEIVVVLLLAMHSGIRPALVAAIVGAVSWHYFYLSRDFDLSLHYLEDKVLLVAFLVTSICISFITAWAKHRMEEIEKRRQELAKLYADLQQSHGELQRVAQADRNSQLLLRAQYSLQEALVSSLSDMGNAYMVVENLGIVHSNAALAQLTGYSPEEMLAWPHFIRVFHPDEQDRILNNYLRRIRGEQFDPFYQTAVQHRDGRHIDVDISVAQLKREGSCGVVVLLRDISARKQAEAALQEAEQKYRLLWENTSDAVILIDEQAHIRFANPSVAKIFGYAAEELIGQALSILQPERLRERCALGFQQYLKTGVKKLDWRSTEIVALHRDGHEFPVELSLGQIEAGGISLFTSFIRDISERKRMEIALRTSEQKYRNLVETSSSIIWMIDVEGRWSFVNHVAESTLGYTAEEMLGRPFTDFETAGQAQQDLAVFARVKAGEFVSGKSTFLRKEGIPVILRYNAIMARDAAGNVIGTTGTATDITQQVLNEAALHETMTRLRMVTEQLPVALWTADTEQRFLSFTGAGLLVLSLRPEEVIGRTLCECNYLDSASIAKAKQVLASGEGVSLEDIGVGGHIYLHRIDALQDAQRGVIGLIGMSFDITEQKRYEEALFAEKERTLVTLNSIGDAVITTDIQGRVTYLNPVAENFTGWPMAQALGLPLAEIFRPLDEKFGEIVFDPIKSAFQQGDACTLAGPIILRRRDGSDLAIQGSCTSIMGRDEKVIGIVLVFHDVSESRKLAAQLAFQGTHDALTKLPNRVLLEDRLVQAIAYAERENEQIALMFLDLDRFKNVNDTLGHAVGDELLKMVAQRLSACVRKADTVCRLGGDEFVILLAVAQPERIIDVSGKILAALNSPYLIDQNTLSITSSIGISVYPDDGIDFEVLAKHADLAMYHAKEQGRNNYQFYTAEMNAKANARQSLEYGLRRALDEGELALYYQPQMNLTSGLMIGAEALLRWRDPKRGLVLPTEFIAIAEESGLILPIGVWVLNEVCRQNRAWQDAGLAGIRIAVNCSALQFRDSALLKNVTDALSRYRLDPACLELELTESIIMHEAESVILVLNALKEIGVRLSIDDFGTGYSSLSYLKRFPVNTLKIDQSFVHDITTSLDDAAISQAIVSMGHSLRLEVIAEGVEDLETVNFLRAQQCDEIQGNYLSRPLPADEFEKFLSKVE